MIGRDEAWYKAADAPGGAFSVQNFPQCATGSPLRFAEHNLFRFVKAGLRFPDVDAVAIVFVDMCIRCRGRCRRSAGPC